MGAEPSRELFGVRTHLVAFKSAADPEPQGAACWGHRHQLAGRQHASWPAVLPDGRKASGTARTKCRLRVPLARSQRDQAGIACASFRCQRQAAGIEPLLRTSAASSNCLASSSGRPAEAGLAGQADHQQWLGFDSPPMTGCKPKTSPRRSLWPAAPALGKSSWPWGMAQSS